MSKVPAHYELIPDIIRLRDEVAPRTLLTINGDIADHTHGLQLVHQFPGVDGIMIGRGVFHDPFCFTNKASEKSQDGDRRLALIDLLDYHLELFDHWQLPLERPYETLKRFFKIYVRDFDGAAEVRDQLMHTTSTDEARRIIHGAFDDAGQQPSVEQRDGR